MSESAVAEKAKKNELAKVGGAKPLSPNEKVRIEKLIEGRADNLKEYLGSLQAFVNEASEHQPFARQKDVEATKKQIAQLSIEQERIAGQRRIKEDAVIRVLKEQFKEKQRRLRDLEARLERKRDEQIEAAEQVVREEFDKQESELRDRELELMAKLNSLETERSQEKLFRRLAVDTSFNALKSTIQDGYTKAVENLYTDAIMPEDGKQCLNELPDATTFRKHVSPEKMFDVFNAACKLTAIPADKLKCEGCGSVNVYHRGMRQVCIDCGHTSRLPDEIREMVRLPTLQEIMSGQVHPEPDQCLVLEHKVVVEQAESGNSDS